MPLITEEQVVLDLAGADRHEATRALAERLVVSGRCTDLDTFLADAYRRGVLRQSGAVYQFRHVRLQQHLAKAYRTSN